MSPKRLPQQPKKGDKQRNEQETKSLEREGRGRRKKESSQSRARRSEAQKSSSRNPKTLQRSSSVPLVKDSSRKFPMPVHLGTKSTEEGLDVIDHLEEELDNAIVQATSFPSTGTSFVAEALKRTSSMPVERQRSNAKVDYTTPLISDEFLPLSVRDSFIVREKSTDDDYVDYLSIVQAEQSRQGISIRDSFVLKPGEEASLEDLPSYLLQQETLSKKKHARKKSRGSETRELRGVGRSRSDNTAKETTRRSGVRRHRSDSAAHTSASHRTSREESRKQPTNSSHHRTRRRRRPSSERSPPKCKSSPKED